MDIFDGISDTRLQNFLQRYIYAHEEANKNPKLDGLKHCGSQVLPQVGGKRAVYIMKNDKNQTKTANLAHCHNIWACPRCSARVMAERAGDIACAIDALSTWYQEYPMMITFTTPHDSKMTCQETTNLLMKSWRMFSRSAKKTADRKYTLKTTVGKTQNKSYDKEYLLTYRTGERAGQSRLQKTGTKNEFDQRAVGTAGEVRTYKVKCDPWGEFRETFNIKHYVKVYEYTYGENGWHAHIHALFWTHKDNFPKIAAYEEALFERWWHCLKHEHLKMLNKKYPDQKQKNKDINKLYFCDWKKIPNGLHRSLFISKDKTGEIRKISSSHYLSGWGGDLELTGQAVIKRAKEGHYNPFELLELAYKNPSNRDYYMGLFLEYAKTVHKHRRVEWSSHSKIRQIIERWKKTNTYITHLKKKVMDKANGKWRVVVWFSQQQWKIICHYDSQSDSEIREEILELARAPDGAELIQEFCLKLDPIYLDISKNTYDRDCELIENQMRENKILAAS